MDGYGKPIIIDSADSDSDSEQTITYTHTAGTKRHVNNIPPRVVQTAVKRKSKTPQECKLIKPPKQPKRQPRNLNDAQKVSKFIRVVEKFIAVYPLTPRQMIVGLDRHFERQLMAPAISLAAVENDDNPWGFGPKKRSAAYEAYAASCRLKQQQNEPEPEHTFQYKPRKTSHAGSSSSSSSSSNSDSE